MKLKLLTLILMLATPALLLIGVKPANATDIVGTQNYEVSWYGAVPASKYVIYFGQWAANKDNSLILDGTSRSVGLHYLKPCTTYYWNVSYQGIDNNWGWVWGSDKSFTTGGVCKVPTIGSMVRTSAGTQATVTGVNAAVASWSVVNGATGYTVYYGASDNKRAHSVTVSDKVTSTTINFLNPSTTYYYQVAAWVGGNQVWGPEQVLTVGGTMKPILGAQTNSPYTGFTNSVLGDTTIAQQPIKSCTPTGKATVSWNGGSKQIVHYHVFFTTVPGHNDNAVADIPDAARSIDLKSLNTCAKYYYSVQAVGVDGSTWWVKNGWVSAQ